MAKSLIMRVTEPQAEFLAKTCKYPAFVGGFGAGKTETMCNQAIIDASIGHGAIIGLYEPTYDLIRMILVPKLLSKLDFFGIEYDYNQTAGTVKTKSNQFGDFILKSVDSPDKLVGYETLTSHIDEIDTLSRSHADEVWIKVMGRNRQVLKGVPIEKQPNRISVYSTPEGFNFIYDRWVKNKLVGYEIVKASTMTNPFLKKDYVEDLLKSYPPELVAAYVNGDFVNLKTGSIYKSYNRLINNSKEKITGLEDLYIGMDFNVTKMAAGIAVLRGKHRHFVSELKNVFDTEAMIKILQEKFPGHRIVVYPDASGISRHTTNANVSDIALLEKSGFEVRAPRKNPFVKDRINAVNAAFSKGEVFVNYEECPTIAECLEQQVYDDNGEPDKKTGKDHMNDAVGYQIAYEMPIKKPVIQIPVDYIRGN